MAERVTIAELERALAATGSRIEVPEPPPMGPAVRARIRAGQIERGTARPPFPGLAAWPRRRVALLVVGALLILAAAIGAARLLVVGAVQVRVVPSVAPPAGSGPSLGPSVTVARAQGLAGFAIRIPGDLGPPDEIHVIDTSFARRVVVLAWRPGAGLPVIGGTPWGSLLMELPSDRGPLAYKDLAGQNRLDPVQVDGAHGSWIEGPHDLVLTTDSGDLRLYVRGNVLLWDADGVTYRLETALDRGRAVGLAGSLG
ncbi:MAG TPA: hypothetical protein VF984_09485 [Actinomycetota bacterium]